MRCNVVRTYAASEARIATFEKQRTACLSKINALRDDTQAGNEEYEKLEAELRTHEGNIEFLRQSADAAIRNMLLSSRSLPITVHQSDLLTIEQRQVSTTGVQVAQRFMGDLPYGTIDINVIPSQEVRSEFDSQTRTLYVGTQVNSKTGVSEIVHEIGHWPEAHDEAVNRLLISFLMARTDGCERELLSDVMDDSRFGDETTLRDEFLDPYMGRDYRDEHGNIIRTEILSVGLEYFYSNPAVLAIDDAEYFNFIYGIIHNMQVKSA